MWREHPPGKLGLIQIWGQHHPVAAKDAHIKAHTPPKVPDPDCKQIRPLFLRCCAMPLLDQENPVGWSGREVVLQHEGQFVEVVAELTKSEKHVMCVPFCREPMWLSLWFSLKLPNMDNSALFWKAVTFPFCPYSRLKATKMRFFFKRWLDFEMKWGDAQSPRLNKSVKREKERDRETGEIEKDLYRTFPLSLSLCLLSLSFLFLSLFLFFIVLVQLVQSTCNVCSQRAWQIELMCTRAT